MGTMVVLNRVSRRRYRSYY